MRRENPLHVRAKREFDCPRCHAAAGEHCQRLDGKRPIWPPHKSRIVKAIPPTIHVHIQ